MKIVETFADLPDPEEWSGFCGVAFDLVRMGGLFVRRRGIYWSDNCDWHFHSGEHSELWRSEFVMWTRVLRTWPDDRRPWDPRPVAQAPPGPAYKNIKNITPPDVCEIRIPAKES